MICGRGQIRPRLPGSMKCRRVSRYAAQKLTGLVHVAILEARGGDRAHSPLLRQLYTAAAGDPSQKPVDLNAGGRCKLSLDNLSVGLNNCIDLVLPVTMRLAYVQSVSSTSTRVLEAILERIRNGEWPGGDAGSRERVLVDQLGVSQCSRSPVDASGHGSHRDRPWSRSRVCRIDATILSRSVRSWFPWKAKLPFVQVYEMRLALESRCAYLAAAARRGASASHG